MKIGVDARCFIGNRTGVANNVFMLLLELIKIRPDDEIYLYSSKDFNIPIKNERIVKRVGRTLFAKSGVVWSLTECRHTIIRDGIDVFWGPGGMLPKSHSKLKTILTINDFVWKKYPGSMRPLFRLAFSFLSLSAISSATKVFTISEAVASELSFYTGRTADAVIRPAASCCFYRRTEPEIEAMKGKYGISTPYYLIVGTLEPRKNLETFLRAYSDIMSSQKNFLPSVKLVIAGGKGWRDKSIIKHVIQAESDGWLKRIGYVDDEDLPALYSGASIFFMPSLYEGFGMPVLEARCCGAPLIVSDVPAMHEAGGDEPWYHAPTYEGIYAMLEKILIHNELPPNPGLNSVEWSWRSGALALSKLIDDALSG